MKAICIQQFKQLEGILDKGDVVEIEVIKSTEDKVIVHKTVDRIHPLQQLRITEDTIAPAGSYEEWKFKSKNGHYYTGTGITNRIGNKTLFDLFEKL
jgi:methionine-rich copper-binding protein CopC